MILGNINTTTPEERFLPERLQQALDYIRVTDFSTLENNKYEIDGKNLFAMVQENETEPKELRTPESHKNYIDIQYIVSGEETFGLGFTELANEISEEYNEEKDIIYYKKVVDETEITLKAGMFLILFPEDIHRPGYFAKSAGEVRKVVVKVKIN